MLLYEGIVAGVLDFDYAPASVSIENRRVWMNISQEGELLHRRCGVRQSAKMTVVCCLLSFVAQHCHQGRSHFSLDLFLLFCSHRKVRYRVLARGGAGKWKPLPTTFVYLALSHSHTRTLCTRFIPPITNDNR